MYCTTSKLSPVLMRTHSRVAPRYFSIASAFAPWSAINSSLFTAFRFLQDVQRHSHIRKEQIHINSTELTQKKYNNNNNNNNHAQFSSGFPSGWRFAGLLRSPWLPGALGAPFVGRPLWWSRSSTGLNAKNPSDEMRKILENTFKLKFFIFKKGLKMFFQALDTHVRNGSPKTHCRFLVFPPVFWLKWRYPRLQGRAPDVAKNRGATWRKVAATSDSFWSLDWFVSQSTWYVGRCLWMLILRLYILIYILIILSTGNWVLSTSFGPRLDSLVQVSLGLWDIKIKHPAGSGLWSHFELSSVLATDLKMSGWRLIHGPTIQQYSDTCQIKKRNPVWITIWTFM